MRVKYRKSAAAANRAGLPVIINVRRQPTRKVSPLRSNAAPVARYQPVRRRAAAISVPKPLMAKRSVRQLPNTKTRLKGRVIPPVHANAHKRSQENSESVLKLKSVGQNRILVIVGNGPSHKEADLPRLKNHPSIDFMSINRPDNRVWPTEHWLFCDNTQFKQHQSLWAGYRGNIINSSAIKASKANSTHIKSLHGNGFSTNVMHGMYIGRSSVYAAIQVGLWMGYEHIYIYGCDMCKVNGKVYPWGSNPDVSDKSRVTRFKHEADHYLWLGKNLDQRLRDKITFCSRYNTWPFMEYFDHLDHESSIDMIINKYSKMSPQT